MPIIFLLSVYLPCLNGNGPSYKLDSVYYITIILPALPVFYIVRYFFENKNFNTKTAKILTETSLLTFGIYLTHFILNSKLANLGFVKNIFLQIHI